MLIRKSGFNSRFEVVVVGRPLFIFLLTLGCVSPRERRVAAVRARIPREGAVAECWRRETSRYPDHPAEHIVVRVAIDARGHATRTVVDGARNLRLPVCIRAEMPFMNFGDGPAMTVDVPITLSLR